MYQQVYFHRTVRAIDLDLGEVFGPSIRAIFGDGSPAERLAAYADLDEYALLHQAARWARGECDRRRAGRRRRDGDHATSPRAGGRSCCASRAGGPRPRSGPSTSAAAGPRRSIASLGTAEPGRVAIDLAVVDARPADATATDGLLALETRDGSSPRWRRRWRRSRPTG